MMIVGITVTLTGRQNALWFTNRFDSNEYAVTDECLAPNPKGTW